MSVKQLYNYNTRCVYVHIWISLFQSLSIHRNLKKCSVYFFSHMFVIILYQLSASRRATFCWSKVQSCHHDTGNWQRKNMEDWKCLGQSFENKPNLSTCGQPKDLIRPQIWTVNQPITKKASVSNSKDFPSQGLATFFLWSKAPSLIYTRMKSSHPMVPKKFFLAIHVIENMVLGKQNV